MRFTEISESTVAGSISTVSMPMMTQTRENISVPGLKPVQYLMKGKVKKKGSYGNSISESKVNEEDISEQDLIIVPGQGRTSKTGLIKHGQSRLDHEVEMARSDLFSAAKNAKKVFNMIKDVSEEEGLEGWVQEKIIKANDYLNTIREYLEGKQVQGVAEGEGNFVGDGPQPNIGGATVKRLGVDNAVTYFGQPAKILAQSTDRKHSRIEITKGTGGVVQTVLTSDLKRVGQGVAEGRLDELGNTDAGRKALRAVQKRGGDEITAWNKKPESGYSPTPTNAAKHFDASVSAGNRLYGHGPNTLRKDTVLARDAMRRYHKGEPITPEEVKIISKWYPGFKVEEGVKGQQGIAEGVADMHSDELLNTVRDAIRKAIKETGDQSLSKIFVCLRSAIPASEALKNITSPISLEAVDNALQEVGIDFDDLLNFINKQAEKYGKQGVAEGSRNAYLKHNNLVDIEKPLAGLKSEFEKFLQTHDPKEKQKYQQGIKQRIKSEPMSGPKGVLPEQGVAEGAKVDRMVKHVAQSEKKLGKSKDEAENIAWATANKRGMLDNKNKKA